MPLTDIPEWQLPGEDGEDDREDDESVEEQSGEHGDEVESEVAQDLAQVLHLQDLPSDEEEDSDGRHVDDPGGDGHHGLGQAGEEVQQRLAALLHHGQGHSQHHCKSIA